MKRMLPPVVLAIVVLSVLLGIKIYAQRAALTGPAGGSGVVEGTTVRLSSRVGGRVAEIAVSEGTSVSEGTLILRLDCVEPGAALAEAEARVEAARRQADAAERASDAAKAAASAVSAQARAADAQGGAATRQAERLASVTDDVSAAQRDQARATADGMAAQSQAADAQRRAGAAQAEAAEAQAEAARQAVLAGEAALERARIAAADCEVLAPRDGVVQMLPFEAGELVGTGATLATLVDLSEVTATFYLPNADLAAAAPGVGAEVRADAYGDRVFTGSVATVATEPEFTPRNIQTRSDRDRLVYKVEVAVPNEDGALRPGMPVEVTLLEAVP